MIFQSNGIYVKQIDNEDIHEVLEVYNSNEDFLLYHLDKSKVTKEWILQELENMRNSSFQSCKVVEISTGRIIGILDFQVDVETYLSLLMIHNSYQGRGYGKLIYRAFEEYAKSLNSKMIRVDVVTNYDKSVLDFWVQKGFIKYKDIQLNWTDKILPAITMKKLL